MKKINEKKLNLDTFSGVACYILLLVYRAQMNDYSEIKNFCIEFEDNIVTGIGIKDRLIKNDKLCKEISEITDNKSLLRKAFDYLNDKNLLTFSAFGDNDESLSNFHLTDEGIDIVEGNNKKFSKTFNLSFHMNIDNIIKINGIGAQL